MMTAQKCHTRFSHPCHTIDLQDMTNIKITFLKCRNLFLLMNQPPQSRVFHRKQADLGESQSKVSTGLSYSSVLVFKTKAKKTTSILNSMIDTTKAAMVDDCGWFYKMSTLWQRSHCEASESGSNAACLQ